MLEWLRRRNAPTRVAVIESLPVDGKRRVILVRRDNIEHSLSENFPPVLPPHCVAPNLYQAAKRGCMIAGSDCRRTAPVSVRQPPTMLSCKMIVRGAKAEPPVFRSFPGGFAVMVAYS